MEVSFKGLYSFYFAVAVRNRPNFRFGLLEGFAFSFSIIHKTVS